ncbi:hypothetical protein E2C01_009206 [Portunus trituberculatus]|uniref:Uncharacterized protein n=1 Tax=Portunus trituberculatus TaxID=210409 RepID=A0A5B7D2V6_PORTR|nr:hypothetical protein [Portunus trituberculatus]
MSLPTASCAPPCSSHTPLRLVVLEAKARVVVAAGTPSALRRSTTYDTPLSTGNLGISRRNLLESSQNIVRNVL